MGRGQTGDITLSVMLSTWKVFLSSSFLYFFSWGPVQLVCAHGCMSKR